MSEMVERIAAIIWNYDNASAYESLDEGSKQGCRETARAVIEAMRKPTPEMISAYIGPRWAANEDIEDKHDRMINAALGKVDA